MIKIYFNNKKLILEKAEDSKNLSDKEIKQIIDEISNEKSAVDIKINCDDEEQTLKSIKSFFRIVKAAGGVVKNNKGEILFIYRNNKWDLPKGKIDKGESIKDAAIREVKEECGLKNLEIIHSLSSTYHTYNDEGQVLKETYWFLMVTDDEELIPQTEENITKAEWKYEAEKEAIYANTYGSIQDVIENVWNV